MYAIAAISNDEVVVVSCSLQLDWHGGLVRTGTCSVFSGDNGSVVPEVAVAIVGKSVFFHAGSQCKQLVNDVALCCINASSCVGSGMARRATLVVAYGEAMS